MARYAVIGATSWGVTLAWLLNRNGHNVTLVVRSTDEAERVQLHHGIERLPAISLPGDVEVTCDPDREVFAGAVMAAPVQSASHAAARFWWDGVPALSAAKGIEVSTGRRVSEILTAAGAPTVSTLSGPNLSHEIAASLPAAAVVASTDATSAASWQQALSTREFRAYTSDDIVGVELAGALKNVVAIAAGAAWGREFGANAVATIMTRGLAEMTRLGAAMGANPLTFQGLAGVGDLAATCFSPLSRNRRFGELLGRGATVEAAFATVGEAVEGAATAGVALQLAARANVELPIAAQVASVIAGQSSVTQAMDVLLNRPVRAE